MKRKNVLILIIGLVIVILTPTYYFNSDKYITKLAKEKQKLRIDECNKIEKKYLPEGSYVYNKRIQKIENERDEFGKNVMNIVPVGYQKIKFSFTSNELIIDYPYLWRPTNWRKWDLDVNLSCNHVREVIKFNNNWEFQVPGEMWVFYVSSWEVINFKTGKVIVDVFEEVSKRKEDWEKIRITLSMDAEVNRLDFTNNWHFETTGLYLCPQEHIDYYDQGLTPDYVSNFKYQDLLDIYDLNTFKPRQSLNDLVKNILRIDP